MVEEKGVLKSLLKTEASSINRNIIKRRKTLAKLLENPVFEEGDITIELDKNILEEIAVKLTSPPSKVLLPVTIYIPAGISEGCIKDEYGAKTADELGAKGMSRGGKYWIQKYRAKSLCQNYPNIFQILYTA
jgi:uncharacterized protein (UPF0216 family)